jgi:hypothetical protein
MLYIIRKLGSWVNHDIVVFILSRYGENVSQKASHEYT